MSLIRIPLVIWREILNNWLGNLRGIFRLDLAFCFASDVNPLVPAYAGKAFRFPDSTLLGNCKATVSHLIALRMWMESRHVYISHLVLRELGRRSDLVPLWEELLSFYHATILNLTIQHPPYSPFLAVFYRLKLQKLSLESFDPCGNICSSVEQLLEYNAETLMSFKYHCSLASVHDWESKRMQYLSLRNVSWIGDAPSNMCGFLRGCPNLQNLSFEGNIRTPSAVLAAAIANSCPLLQRLRMCTVNCVNGDVLQVIASGCPQLRYLEATCDFSPRIERISHMVRALTCLHTLALGKLLEEELLEIAAAGHPSLRVIDTETIFTTEGLRQLTAAMPQLTGLAIHSIHCSDVPGSCAGTLEHCGGLQRLRVGALRTPQAIIDEMLQEVVAHCPKLHTLSVAGAAHSPAMLSAVVARCPALRRLDVPLNYHVELPRHRRNIRVSSRVSRLVEWMPED